MLVSDRVANKESYCGYWCLQQRAKVSSDPSFLYAFLPRLLCSLLNGVYHHYLQMLPITKWKVARVMKLYLENNLRQK